MQPLLNLFYSRNYRLYFTGQFISQIGNWMTQTATLWLVYQLTQSVFLLGLIGFATQIPTIVLSPLAGVWADRLDRIRLLSVTQTLAALQSLALAGCVFGGKASFAVLVNLAVIQGIINAFDLPARQALTSMLAEKREDLGGIVSLNSTLVNLGRMLGPALAGFVIAGVGAGFCFVLDAVSYVAAIVALLALRLRARPSACPCSRCCRPMPKKGLAGEGGPWDFSCRAFRVGPPLRGSSSPAGVSAAMRVN